MLAPSAALMYYLLNYTKTAAKTQMKNGRVSDRFKVMFVFNSPQLSALGFLKP